MIEVVPEETLAMEKNSGFCNVTAIIRCEVLEKVERRLQGLGVSGMSVTRVRGRGEYTNFYSSEGMATHDRIEILVHRRIHCDFPSAQVHIQLATMKQNSRDSR